MLPSLHTHASACGPPPCRVRRSPAYAVPSTSVRVPPRPRRAPRPSQASPSQCSFRGPAQGHAVPRPVPRPRGEQAVLTTLSHYIGAEINCGPSPSSAHQGWGWGGGGGLGRDLWAPLPRRGQSSEHRPGSGNASGACHARSPLARGPAGALARSIARTPPEGGGCAAPCNATIRPKSVLYLIYILSLPRSRSHLDL